jgi:sugar phosphate permease
MCQLLLQEPRHQITLLWFMATFIAYVERVGFSIAYTAMAKRANVSESVKGTVLSAFYWGYGVSQVAQTALQSSVVMTEWAGTTLVDQEVLGKQ